MIKLPDNFKAFIFDLDGTLADTMPAHYKACQLVCNEKGFDFPEDYFYQEAGKPTLEVFRNLVKILGRGTLSAPLKITAHKFTASAKAAIEAAGGEAIDA